LGNTGDESAVPDLEKVSHDSEPLIAEHARWAISEIESRQKQAGGTNFTSPT
jgi:epoxyqueuosine reductase